MGRTTRVLIGGSPVGWGNLGEDAIVNPLVCRLKLRLPAANIGVITSDFATVADLWQVKAVGFEQKSYIRCFMWADRFVFSGSTMLSELPAYSAMLIGRSHKYRVPALIHGAGVNELAANVDQRSLVGACNKVVAITVRDRPSGLRLRRMGVDVPPIIVTADPAIACEAGDQDYRFIDALVADYNIDLSVPTVGVGICSHPGYETHLPPLQVLAGALEHIASRGYNLLFVPSEINPGHDAWMHMKIANLMKNKQGIHFMVERLSPGQNVALYSKLRCFISTRLHQLILSTAAGTPVLAMARNEKVVNFLERLGQNSVAEPKALAAGQLEAGFDDIHSNYTEHCGRVTAKLAEMRDCERVNEAVMDAFLAHKPQSYFAGAFSDYMV